MSSAIASLDSAIVQMMQDNGGPGFVYGVSYRNETIYSRGFGSRDGMNPSSPAPDDATLFRIGSVTKEFTMLSFQALRFRGCQPSSLDDPVDSIITNFSAFIANPFRQKTPVTFRNLLNHTAGLPREGPCSSNAHCDFSTDQILQKMLENNYGLMYPSGIRASSSNLAFAFVGPAQPFTCG